MKNYFSIQTIVSVIVAMIVFEILNRLFIGNLVEKIAPTKGNFEILENDEDFEDFEDEE